MEVTFAGVAVVESYNLNGVRSVVSVQDDHTFIVRGPSKLTGSVTTERVSVNRLLASTSDGANAYLQFANLVDLNNSDIEAGTRIQIVLDGSSVVVDAGATFKLVSQYLGVVSLDTATFRAYVVAPVTPGAGAIVTNTTFRRAIEYWGSVTAAYYVDWTGSANAVFLSGAVAVTAGYNAPVNPLFLGSYLYDPSDTYTLSQDASTLTTAVLRGAIGPEIAVGTGAADFAADGYIVFAQGTAREEGPIRYSSIYLSGSTYYIRLDPTYRVRYSHPIGERVSRVGTREAPNLDMYGQMFQPYLTGTVAARNKLFDILEDLVAAGVFIEEDVLLPLLKFEDPQIAPYV
jgi:hypothetical protein